SRSQLANRAGKLRIDRIFLSARRRRVVRVIQDEEAAFPEIAEPVQHRSRVGLVDQQAVREEKSRMSVPGIHTEPALAPDAAHVVSIEDLEGETKARFEFLLPLNEHRRR